MTTYTEVFGGTNIYPSDVSFLEFDLSTSDVFLAWPTETNAPNPLAQYVAAQIMNVNCTSGTYKVYLPDASQTSPGQSILFNNIGTQPLHIVDAVGNAIATVGTGQLWQIYLTDNSTVAGSWYPYQFGSALSQAAASLLAGAGLKAIANTLNQAIPVFDISSNYFVASQNRAQVINWTGASGTVSFASTASLGSDFFVYVRNSGTSAITIDPYGTQTINSSATLVMNPNDSAIVFCDGSNLYTIGLGKSSVALFDYDSVDITGTGDYTLTGADLNRISYNFTGTLTAPRNIIVPTSLQQYWVTNSTTGGFKITVKTSAGTGVDVINGQASILYCNGTNVVPGSTAGIAVPVPIESGGTNATTPNAALVNFGGTALGISLFEAPDAPTALTALGGTVVGEAVFTAANQTAAQTALNVPSVSQSIAYAVALG
jgi:hypothetical protein